MGNIGPASLILIILLALILFGPSKLPELGKAAGRTLKEFKNATSGLTEDKETDKTDKSEEKKQTS